MTCKSSRGGIYKCSFIYLFIFIYLFDIIYLISQSINESVSRSVNNYCLCLFISRVLCTKVLKRSILFGHFLPLKISRRDVQDEATVFWLVNSFSHNKMCPDDLKLRSPYQVHKGITDFASTNVLMVRCLDILNAIIHWRFQVSVQKGSYIEIRTFVQ